jgi:hypothetical protein
MASAEPPPDLEARIDERLAQLAAMSEPARDTGEALLGAAVELHTPALVRLLEQLRDAGGDDAVARAMLDPLVGPILALHDLVPASSAPEPTVTHLPLPKLRTRPPGADPAEAPSDRCELCGAALLEHHGHGVDVEQHRLVCLCDPCRVVLSANRDGHGRFRALPDRVIADPDFAGADGEWEALGIPVSTAFFFHDSVAGGIVAFYPSPAGATESLLGAQQWEDLARTSLVAADLAPDTEAMLVRRSATARESYLVPVDRCYELVGLLRRHWRGFDGGQDAHDALDELFGRIRTDARDARTGAFVGA